MNKRIISIICIIFLLFSLSLCCSAHSGKTDSNGGHTDRATGKYHYHHGYPAHQHLNGICPYEFDDNTSSENASNKNEINDTTNDSKSNWDNIKIVLWFFLLPFVPTSFFVFLFYRLYELIAKKHMTKCAALIISIIIYLAVIFFFNILF